MRMPPAPLLILFALAACEPADNDPGPGGVTIGEARALDEAAEMVEQHRLPESALEEPATGAPADSTATAD